MVLVLVYSLQYLNRVIVEVRKKKKKTNVCTNFLVVEEEHTGLPIYFHQMLILVNEIERSL